MPQQSSSSPQFQVQCATPWYFFIRTRSLGRFAVETFEYSIVSEKSILASCRAVSCDAVCCFFFCVAAALGTGTSNFFYFLYKPYQVGEARTRQHGVMMSSRANKCAHFMQRFSNYCLVVCALLHLFAWIQKQQDSIFLTFFLYIRPSNEKVLYVY